MRKILIGLLTLVSAVAFGQSETHDFITYDTMYTLGANKWLFRISRPANLFTANHPDTAKRPAIIHSPGMGESQNNSDGTKKDSAQLSAGAKLYGPHSWIASGQWDGSVPLANGTHYPIIISAVPNYVNPRGPELNTVLTHLINTYKIKPNSVHLTGLSMGAFSWTKAIAYEASAGARTFMSKVTSIVALQGASNETFAPYNAWSLGWNAFATWAEEFGGKFLGLEGSNDNSRKVWQVSQPMNARVPGSAYFAYENIGGGGHCCWRDMYSPFRTKWSAVAPLGDNIVTSGTAPNTQGTYKTGSNVYQWMLRQGDTTLVGSAVTGPIANAGPDQPTVTATSTSLNGSGSTCNSCSISSYLWEKLSGPTGGTISNAAIASPTVSSLSNGTYVYRLTVSDGSNTSADQVSITKIDPANNPPVVSAGADRTITLPKDTVHLDGGATDDGSIIGHEWLQISGPNTATISDNTAYAPAVSNLIAGIYTFQLKATDDDNVTASDEISVTVVDLSAQVPKRLKVKFGSSLSPAEPGWNHATTTSNNAYSSGSLAYDDGSASLIRFTIDNSGTTANNGSTYLDTANLSRLIAPLNVLRWTTTYTGNRTLVISGLTVGFTYNIDIISSRASGGSSTETSVAGYDTISIKTLGNAYEKASYSNIAPSANGTITIPIVGKTVSYVNGFVVTEVGATSDVNDPPSATIAPVNPITLPTGSVNLVGSAFDPEGDSLIYNWVKLSGPAGTTFNYDTILSPTVSGLTAGTHVFQLTVTDYPGGLSASATVTVVVNAAGNILPVPGMPGNVSLTLANGATSIDYTVVANPTDADGSIVYRNWAHESGPAGSIIVTPDQNSTEIRNMVPGLHQYSLTVRDNKGAEVKGTIQITVNAYTAIRKKMIGPGEYQLIATNEQGIPYGLGNLSNIGTNGSGTVGILERMQIPTDIRVKGAYGGLHGVGVIADNGDVYLAGDNWAGQLGLGHNTDPYLLATKITFDADGQPFTNVKKLSAFFRARTGGGQGWLHDGWFGLKDNGDLYVWGSTGGGYKGNGSATDTLTTRPTRIVIPGDRKVKEIVSGQMALVLCTDGTVWTFGNDNPKNLGYAATGSDYLTPHQVPGLTDIEMIGGGGTVNYAIKGTQLYGFGAYSAYMCDQRVTSGSGTGYTIPTLLTNITSVLPARIVKIAVNYATTQVILEDGSMWSWGDNAMGGVGNGESLDWTTTTPNYAWPGNAGLKLVRTPVQIGKGILWDEVWSSNTYGYWSSARDMAGNLYWWGRGKDGPIFPDRLKSINSTVNAQNQDHKDRNYPTLLIRSNEWPSYTTVFSVTAPHLAGAATAPVARAGNDTTITTNRVALKGSNSTDGTWIMKYTWRIISAPGSAYVINPAGPDAELAGLSDGVAQVELMVENVARKTHKDTVNITVAQNGNNPPTASIVASALEITLPVSEVTLSGVVTDPDVGNTTSYLWRRAAGTTIGNFSSTTSSITKVSGLTVPGTYTFELEGSDNLGLKSVAQITITVKPAAVQPNNPAKYLERRNHVGLKGVKF